MKIEAGKKYLTCRGSVAEIRGCDEVAGLAAGVIWEKWFLWDIHSGKDLVGSYYNLVKEIEDSEPSHEKKVQAAVDACIEKHGDLLQKLADNPVHKGKYSKPPLHLLPFDALKEVAEVLNMGCVKYAEGDWKDQIKNNREGFLRERQSSLLRHYEEYQRGLKQDKESGLHPMAHLACNALFLLWADLNK